jgi:hypothetical protein
MNPTAELYFFFRSFGEPAGPPPIPDFCFDLPPHNMAFTLPPASGSIDLPEHNAAFTLREV